MLRINSTSSLQQLFVTNEITKKVNAMKLQSDFMNSDSKITKKNKNAFDGDVNVLSILSDQIHFLQNQKILMKNNKDVKNPNQFPMEDKFIYLKRGNKSALYKANNRKVSSKLNTKDLPLYNHFSSIDFNVGDNNNESDNNASNNESDNSTDTDVEFTKRATRVGKSKLKRSPLRNQFDKEQLPANRRNKGDEKSSTSVAKEDHKLKTTTILSDSIPKRFNMKDFNESVNGGKTYIKALPTLKENKPDVVIIHVGYNDLTTRDEINVKEHTWF